MDEPRQSLWERITEAVTELAGLLLIVSLSVALIAATIVLGLLAMYLKAKL